MKGRWLAVWTVGAALGFGAWGACGDDDGGPTDGGDTGGDTAGSCSRTDECLPGERCEGTPRSCLRVLPTLDDTGADMTCLGNNPLPPPGTGTVTITVYVEDFQDDVQVEGAVVDLYFDNLFDDSPDLEGLGPADGSGEISGVEVPARARIAVRVREGELPGGDVKNTVEYDVETPDADGGRMRALSVSDTTFQLIPTILGITPDADHGIIAGQFGDCAGDAVEGAVVRMVNGSGADCRELNERECYARYFVDDYPSRIDNQPYTSADGLYAVAQVPPGDWTLQLLGRLTDDSPGHPYDLLGEQVVRATADAIVVVDVRVLDE